MSTTACLSQLAHRAVHVVALERGSVQEPPGSAEAGDARAFGVAWAVTMTTRSVRERALALVG